LGVSVWHILEYEYTELPESSVGHFHSGDSYVVRWLYTITVTGELRCVSYFINSFIYISIPLI